VGVDLRTVSKGKLYLKARVFFYAILYLADLMIQKLYRQGLVEKSKLMTSASDVIDVLL
jgi:hypothetical protein